MNKKSSRRDKIYKAWRVVLLTAAIALGWAAMANIESGNFIEFTVFMMLSVLGWLLYMDARTHYERHAINEALKAAYRAAHLEGVSFQEFKKNFSSSKEERKFFQKLHREIPLIFVQEI